MTGAALIPMPFIGHCAGPQGQPTVLMFSGRIVGSFSADFPHVGQRVVELLDRYGLADIPDTIEGMA